MAPINDMIFIDGMIVLGMDEERLDGFAGHRLDNTVDEDDDLIKLWEGAAAL